MLFPKGGWELDKSIEEAALRETEEEAGVRGKVQNKLGEWGVSGDKDITQSTVIVAEARELCQHWWMKEALDRLVRRLMQLQEDDIVRSPSCSLSEKETATEEEVAPCVVF
ncbi:nudix hydrolase 17, mitochondrial-like [Telopea speciosissima]|uniref:nudix hydrolase 17, mitochondrial-like n=1 Tax=Telopea speciosissima TaxID=54955 RepID=UPI001CC388E3|nr:nudix hydrolase 17, mitochondrial-like [Telopea speciosissima]